MEVVRAYVYVAKKTRRETCFNFASFPIVAATEQPKPHPKKPHPKPDGQWAPRTAPWPRALLGPADEDDLKGRGYVCATRSRRRSPCRSSRPPCGSGAEPLQPNVCGTGGAATCAGTDPRHFPRIRTGGGQLASSSCLFWLQMMASRRRL